MQFSPASIILVYSIIACVFFLLDLLWLGVAAKEFYAKQLGSMLRNQVNWIAAILFYAIYIGGIQLFVILPVLQSGLGLLRAAILGGALGIFAYGTFNLTSLALLSGWPLKMVVVDMIWGTFLTAATVVITLLLVRILFKEMIP